MAQARAAHDERDGIDEQVHETGAQVGLRHDAEKRHGHDAEHLEVFPEIVELRAVARDQPGIEQDGELARLQAHAEIDPAARAVAFDADHRQMRGEDEHDVHDEQQRRITGKLAIVHAADDEHQDGADADARQLAGERIGFVALHGGIHDDEPVGHEAREHAEKLQGRRACGILLHERARGAGPAAVGIVRQAQMLDLVVSRKRHTTRRLSPCPWRRIRWSA